MSVISKATIVAIKEYGKEIREYELQLEKNYYFEAGSFLLLTLEKQENYSRWPESRNFSIASAYNEDGIIKLLIRKVGEYTTRIFNELAVGSSCMVKYAFGDFLLPFFDKISPIYCFAGGTGIAPILSFCEQLKQQNQESRLHVYYSFKNKTEQPGLENLRNIIPQSQLHLFCTREKIEGIPHRRMNTQDILQANVDITNAHFYICGGETFTNEFVSFLEENKAENIYTDEW